MIYSKQHAAPKPVASNQLSTKHISKDAALILKVLGLK